MATASNAARLLKLVCQRAPLAAQRRVARIAQHNAFARRALSTSTSRWATKDDREERGMMKPAELKLLDEAFAKSATPEGLQQLDALAKDNGFSTIDEYLKASLGSPEVYSEDRTTDDDLRQVILTRQNKESFWYQPEEYHTEEWHTDEHDEFNEDDITSMAHGKLDEVREMRHYDRLAVWEMPLLSKFAKPFQPPTNDQVLRWRYTTYMGEVHPAEKKVVVQFAPDDLKLTPVQTEKLKKLAGPRYNPETEMIKISCESYEYQAQNKRYLSSLVDDMVAAAKDPKDTFEDIPLDTRHHQFKNKPKFPVEWRMSEERRLQLEAYRQRAADQDREKEEKGQVVHGQQLIEQTLMQNLLAEQAQEALEKEKKDKVAELIAARPSRGAGRAARRL